MAAELEKMEPPFSLHSMDSTGSSDHDIDLVADVEDEEHEHKGVFVLREKRGVIYPLDYKYRVDTCYPGYNPRFVNAPTVITLVGLPARGKTYMAKKLGRYLNWIGIKTKVFNVGEYRRRAVGSDKLHDFFRVDNTEAQTIRRQCAIACLEDVSKFLSRGGQVAIFDATNTTLERRALIMDFCTTRGFKVFFMESICEDQDIVAANIKVMGHEFVTKEEFKLWEVWVDSPASSLPQQEVKVFSPDYVTVDRDTAVEDFRERIKHYEDAYQPLSLEKEGNLSFIKIINAGEQYLVNNIDGYLQSRAVYFLMNSHIKKRSIYLARHGESEFNVQKRLGGDSDLTVRGEEFSFALAKFIDDEKLKDLKVWTSQLKRAVDTAQYLKGVSIERWKALNEMDHGIYDGMTLDEIKNMDPEEHKVKEEHPFNYRYPRGESYSDVCARLEPVIMELERQSNVLVICHEAILQCLMAYFLDHSSGELPNLRIPFHTVFKLTPIAYGCRVERYPLFVTANSTGSTSDNSIGKRKHKTVWRQGSSRTHALYIWERGVGNLVKILHGTKGELLLEVVWHPIRPIIASISSGVVSIWAQNHVENWSAFAPDFKELDENVEYEEKESEFDIEDEDEEAEVPSETEAGEEDEVDVCAVERIPALCSSDEENDEDLDSIYYLPVAPEVDDPEETGWTQENEIHVHDPEHKRRASQETGAESQRKKVKVIDIRHGSNELHHDSKTLGKHRISPAKRESPSVAAPTTEIEPVTAVPNTLEPELSTDLDTDSTFE